MGRNGVCKQHLQTCGECTFDWQVHSNGEFIVIDIGEFPDCATLTLEGSDADRLFDALRVAILDRNLRWLEKEEGSKAEVSSNERE